ncbi:MAG: FAD binding domain-containing protein, partial [Caldilineaceae bacterium]|nr:FAD binding domain-containing protein [Caldilineaceae bacterium]
MQAFDYVSANSIDEAVLALQKASGSARVLAGGTDLLVALREGRLSAQTVVDIKHVPETTELSYSAENGLRLGAAVPCHRLYNDKEISAAYPGLMDSASLIGGVQIQGRASLGGNLCNASPAADSIPSLIAHGAVCTIAGPNGRGQVAVEDFCTAPGRTVLENGEFLVYMDIPAPKAKFGAAYLRFMSRNEMDIAVVGTGAAVQLSAD